MNKIVLTKSKSRFLIGLPRLMAAFLVAAFAAIGLVQSALAASGQPVSSAILAATVVPVSNQVGQVTWGLAPEDNENGASRPNYAYSGAPGQVLRDAIIISNHSSQDLQLNVYAADAFTTASGQLDLLPADQVSADLGTWVALDVDSVLVPADGSVTIPFTVTIPVDASPGDHSAGIITSVIGDSNGENLQVDQRLALRMHLRVDGELAPGITVSAVEVSQPISLNPFHISPIVVQYTVENTGNSRLAPTVMLQAKGPFGWGLSTSGAVELPEMLPGAQITGETELLGLYPLFQLNTEIDLTAVAVGIGGGATATDKQLTTVLAVPWPLLAIVGVLFVATVTAFVLRVAKKKRAANQVQKIDTDPFEVSTN